MVARHLIANSNLVSARIPLLPPALVIPASSAVNVSVMEPRSRKPRRNALRAAKETRLPLLVATVPPLVVEFVFVKVGSRYKGRGRRKHAA